MTFPTVGTSDYTVSLNWLNQGGSTDLKGWMINNQTATSLTIVTSEHSSSTQDLDLRIHLFK